MICVVLGPRRAGKSFFAMHHVQSRGSFGYVNFDDERLAGLTDVDGLVAAVDRVYGDPKHVLLDEVQNLPNWELVVNRLQRQGYRLTVTGSNAHLLSAELATHLTGRHIPVVLFPFSFSEYLRAGGRELTSAETAERFAAYVEAGGYPEPLLKGVSRGDYLATLLRSTVYKDVVVRHRVRSARGISDLANWLMSNTAQRYSLNALAATAGVTSVHTVGNYLSYLEEALLFFSLPRFSFKVREQVRSARKVYCVDNGFITAASFRVSSDRGRLYENLAALTLKRQELGGALELFYWQGPDQEEVDFVVKQGTRVTSLIQVCVSLENPRTRAREQRALLRAGKALRCEDLLILTESEEGEEDASWYGIKGRVRMVPMWRWALWNSGPGYRPYS